jgi:hypothetical protein
VKVGVEVMQLGHLDAISGTFKATFNLYTRWPQKQADDGSFRYPESATIDENDPAGSDAFNPSFSFTNADGEVIIRKNSSLRVKLDKEAGVSWIVSGQV